MCKNDMSVLEFHFKHCIRELLYYYSLDFYYVSITCRFTFLLSQNPYNFRKYIINIDRSVYFL